jgi:hypothetical protein
VEKVSEVVWEVRVHFLTGNVQLQGDEVDLQILHDNDLIGDSCIVLQLQMNGWFRFVACASLILWCTLAQILVRFGSLRARATVSAGLVEALVGQQLTSLSSVPEGTDAIGQVLPMDQSAIGGLTDSTQRTVATVAVRIDFSTFLAREAALAQADMLRLVILNPVAFLVSTTRTSSTGVVVAGRKESEGFGQSIHG